jgi:tetratricopeptide (TPR) repeat protein
MTEKGKKLLIIVVASMVVIFVALFVISEFMDKGGAKKQTKAVAPIAKEKVAVNLTAPEEGAFVHPLPTVTLSRKLQDMASNRHSANRLGEAIDLWEISVYLNDNNNLSRRRLEDAKHQLDRVVQEIIALGNLDYKYLRYKRAIYHWEKVLNLIHDKQSTVYKKTSQKINLARRKMKK